MGVLEPVFETEVLLIDDIGASEPSDWALDTMGHILNKRYNEKRVTLLTTNYLDGSEVAVAPVKMPSGQALTAPRDQTLTDRLGPRIRSRLYEMCRTVELIGPDYAWKFARPAASVLSRLERVFLAAGQIGGFIDIGTLGGYHGAIQLLHSASPSLLQSRDSARSQPQQAGEIIFGERLQHVC